MSQSSLDSSPHEEVALQESGNMFPADVVWKVNLLIAFTIWIILMNGLLVLGLLKRKDRRNNTYNFHIINLAMTDFLFGCTVLPVKVDMFVTDMWNFGAEICQFWLMIDKLLTTVSILIVLVLVAEGSVDLAIPDLSPGSTLPLWAVLIAGPWIIGAAFIIPFFLLRADFSNIPVCKAEFSDLEFVIPLVTFIVPAAVVLCLALVIIIMLFLQRPPAAIMHSQERRKTVRQQTTASCVISVVFVLMWAPYGVTQFLSSLNLGGHPSFNLMLWVAYANSAITPLLWLILPDVRRGFRDMCCCCCYCCCRSRDPTSLPRLEGSSMRVIENKYFVSGRLSNIQENESQTFV
ncbi:beta-1 adrenergic receptor-like [Haliotis cracherodii]|uniref:beta-1 adrenergic receptor-like n=1 Tax=Haliotis rufescens TaxID=6454 RepID=UPI001EB06F8B|nr:beta-1 adrenergic receptor-like [Haliotis rufescens]